MYDTHFLAFHCRKIFIQNLSIDCRIGAYDSEKLRPQQVLFNCELWITLEASTSTEDELGDVLNYDRIVTTITEIATAKHYNLQETLVDTIADQLSVLPGVTLLRLTSAKTKAYPNVQAVGIEVWRHGSSSPLHHEQ